MPIAKPVTPQLQRGHPLAQGLIYAAPFHEGSGSTVADLSGQNNPGTINTDVTWANGRAGFALDFSGVAVNSPTNTVSLNKAIALAGIPFTIAFWIKPKSQAALFGSIGSQNDLFGLWYQGSNGVHNGQINITFATGVNSGALVDKAWSYFAITRNGTTVTTYINGIQDLVFTLTVSSYNFNMYGSDPSGECFLGQLDDYKIWNRALSANEIAQLYFDSQQIYRPRARLSALSPLLLARTPYNPWPQAAPLLAQ